MFPWCSHWALLYEQSAFDSFWGRSVLPEVVFFQRSPRALPRCISVHGGSHCIMRLAVAAAVFGFAIAFVVLPPQVYLDMRIALRSRVSGVELLQEVW